MSPSTTQTHISGAPATGAGGDAVSNTPGSSQETPASQEIDLQALANQVYALLKQELKLERERLGRRRAW